MFTYMVVYDKKYPNKIILKKRGVVKPKYPRLRFGDCGLVLQHTLRFEFTYFFFLRKFLKKLLKRRKRFFKQTYVWVFIRPNHVLTKKGKNSRMGKGKGSFNRWCSILPKGFMFMEFYGISYVRLLKYQKKIQKKIKIPLKLKMGVSNYTKVFKKQYIGNLNAPLVSPLNYDSIDIR